MKKTTWFLILLFFAISCLDEPDCYLLNNDFIGISFAVYGSTIPDTLKVDAFTVNGVPGVLTDDPLPPYNITGLTFQADRLTETMQFKFQTAEGIKTLDLNYQVQVQFVSEDCGARYVLSGLTGSSVEFDSVDVINPTPGRDETAQNIVVYRCPQADTIEVRLWQLSLPKEGASTTTVTSPEFISVDYGGSTLLYENKKASTLHLPVDENLTQTTYSMSFKDQPGNFVEEGDLTLSYAVTEEERYVACGMDKYINSLEIRTAFDSVSFATNSGSTTPRNAPTDPIQTNLNLYRCPATNLIQIAFVEEGTVTSDSASIVSITADYTAEIFYPNAKLPRVVLPLNPDATSTVFTINYGTSTEAITLNYSWANPRSSLFEPPFACSTRKVITNLSVVTSDDVQVVEPAVLYPAVDNLYVEVAN